MNRLSALIYTAILLVPGSMAFGVVKLPTTTTRQRQFTSSLRAGETDLAGPLVTGEQLEMMLTELEQPLVVDAYATW